MSKSKEYRHLLYRGDSCIAKFKSQADAEASRDALVERDVAGLLRAIRSAEIPEGEVTA